MKYFLPYVMIIIINSSLINRVSGQELNTTDSLEKESTIIIPPLLDLIDSAIMHSPVIKFRNLEIDAKESNLKSQRNYWIRNIGLQADTRYGTFDNYSSNASGQSTTILTTTSKQLNYGAGFYIKFPLVDIIDRKNLVNKAKTELEQAKSMEEAQQTEVRQLVIRQYQDVLLKQKLLDIKSHALGNARVNMEMVEKEFRNGVIPVSEYVRISDIVARTESDYETAKTEFISAKMILEDIVGFTFGTGTKDKNEDN